MQFAKFVRHLFFPHESNNQKAKLLHTSSLFLITVGLIGFQLILGISYKTFPRILGYAANIAPSEVISLTNQKRAENGLLPLTENSVLSQAAIAKGNDMLAKGYWAHFAPDGTTPWSFFLNFGYKYRYAGENLARDFSDAGSAVNAWMSSPTHRENILNSKYEEVGIGVVEGNLSGVGTTIIVQFFGTPLTGESSVPVVKAQNAVTTSVKIVPTATPIATIVPTSTPNPTFTPVSSSEGVSASFVSPFSSTKGISLFVIGVLIMIMSIDMIIVKRNKIIRIGGRPLAHIAFFGMIIAVILILKAGQII